MPLCTPPGRVVVLDRFTPLRWIISVEYSCTCRDGSESDGPPPPALGLHTPPGESSRTRMASLHMWVRIRPLSSRKLLWGTDVGLEAGSCELLEDLRYRWVVMSLV